MSLIIDPVLVAVVDQQRTQLIRGAAVRRRQVDTTPDGGRTGSPFLTAGERQRLRAAFAALQPAPVRAKSVDILGYWPPHQTPRHTLTVPSWRVPLGWCIWCCLVALAVAHVFATA